MNLCAKSCYVRCQDQPSISIFLPDQQSVTLGRGEKTGITDQKCSRSQVTLYAIYKNYSVLIQQVGARPSGLNGFKTQAGVKLIAKHTDCLELVYGKYAYQIEFNPPPQGEEEQDSKKEEEPSKKRQHEVDMSDEELKEPRKIRKSENLLNYVKVGKAPKTDQSVITKQNDTIASTSCDDMALAPAAESFWESVDNEELLIYTAQGVENRSKIAAFDMDGTLIKTQSGLVYPKDCSDWQLLYPIVPSKLKEHYALGYKIVIFTNQARLGTGTVNVNDFKLKIERIVKRLGVPIQAYVAIGRGIYRKPSVGMWEKLVEKHKNEGRLIDKNEAFYVGDAAARENNWAPGKKKDHSSADRLLALNLEIRFQTPEEHFLGHNPAPFRLPTFNSKQLPKDISLFVNGDQQIPSKTQEVILMVGCPASGKSYVAKNYLKEYDYVNRDSLGSWQRCMKALEKALTEGKSVVIDNTNRDRATREKYIKLAESYSVPVRCFVMTTTLDHAMHNNKFREITDPTHARVTDIILRSFMKNYVEPKMDEGYKEIVKVNFVPSFNSAEHKTLYEMYLLGH